MSDHKQSKRVVWKAGSASKIRAWCFIITPWKQFWNGSFDTFNSSFLPKSPKVFVLLSVASKLGRSLLGTRKLMFINKHAPPFKDTFWCKWGLVTNDQRDGWWELSPQIVLPEGSFPLYRYSNLQTLSPSLDSSWTSTGVCRPGSGGLEGICPGWQNHACP